MFNFRMNFHKKVLSIKFSPDSKHIAFTKENDVVVYKSPGPYSRDYSPFVFERCLRVSYLLVMHLKAFQYVRAGSLNQRVLPLPLSLSVLPIQIWICKIFWIKCHRLTSGSPRNMYYSLKTHTHRLKHVKMTKTSTLGL